MMIQNKDVSVQLSIEILNRFQAYLEHENLILTLYSPKYAVILKRITLTQKYLYTVHIYNRISKPDLPPLFVCREAYDTKAKLLIWAILRRTLMQQNLLNMVTKARPCIYSVYSTKQLSHVTTSKYMVHNACLVYVQSYRYISRMDASQQETTNFHCCLKL